MQFYSKRKTIYVITKSQLGHFLYSSVLFLHIIKYLQRFNYKKVYSKLVKIGKLKKMCKTKTDSCRRNVYLLNV